MPEIVYVLLVQFPGWKANRWEYSGMFRSVSACEKRIREDDDNPTFSLSRNDEMRYWEGESKYIKMRLILDSIEED